MKILKKIYFLFIFINLFNYSISQVRHTNTELIKHFIDKANSFTDTSQSDSSIYYFNKALLISKDTTAENNLLIAEIYYGLGIVYVKRHANTLALKYLFKAFKNKKNLIGEKHSEIAQIHEYIGNVYYDIKEFDLSLRHYLKALNIYNSPLIENHNKEANIYFNIGEVYFSKNIYDLALEYHIKSYQIRKETIGNINLNIAVSANRIGSLYNKLNEYDLALEYYLEAYKVTKGLFGEKYSYMVNIYSNIGNIYEQKVQYNLALEYYTKALHLASELYNEKHIEVARCYNNIGRAYYGKSEFEIALEYFLKAAQLTEDIKGKYYKDLAIIKTYIGNVYANKNDYYSALENYVESLRINSRLYGKTHPELAKSYTDIGNLYCSIDEYERALAYFIKSLEIIKETYGEKHSYITTNYNNIGTIYANNKKFDIALRYYQKGLAACLKNFNDTTNYYSVPTINDYLDWSETLDILQKKARIFALNPDNIKNLKVALRHYQAADSLICKVRRSISTKSDKLAIGEISNNLYSEAIKVCSIIKLTASYDSRAYYDKLAFYFSEKNKASVLLDALSGVEAHKFAGIHDTLLKKEFQLRKNITLYNKILIEQPNSSQNYVYQDKLFKANREYDNLINFFEKSYPNYYELKYANNNVSISEIQELLDNTTAIISYFIGTDEISIFTITKKKLNVKTIVKTEDLSEKIKNFRYGLIFANSTRFSNLYRQNAYEFNEKLIPSHLSQKISNLIIIPDGELSVIPFETLLTGSFKNKDWRELPYLIKKYNISYSYSVNLFYRTFKTSTKREIEYSNLSDWLALAPIFDNHSNTSLNLTTRALLKEIDYLSNDTTTQRGNLISGEYISPLPATQYEVEEIFKLFDKTDKNALVQLNQNANEEFVKSGELSKYKYIHFATHGFVNALKPELSGLLLSQDSTLIEDGILYSGEIYNLDLNAILTILSACETGLGEIKKGEGIIGLTRALLYAGSKNIIVSLWKVSDNSTSDLMISFYHNLLINSEQNISKALQKAKITMIDDETFSHPFYWSPFILIGK